MSFGLLVIRDIENLGYDSPGGGLLGISWDVLGNIRDQGLRESGILLPWCRTTWEIPGCPWDNLGSGTKRIWDMTPLAKDNLGFSDWDYLV